GNRRRCGRSSCVTAVASASASGPPEAHEMEENGGGENDRVQPVDEAAMAGDHMPPVLDATVSLDRRHDEPAEEAEDRDDEGEQAGLPDREGGHPPEARAGQRGGEDAADE